MNWYKKAQQQELKIPCETEENRYYRAQEEYLDIEDTEKSNILREFNEARKNRKAKPNSQPWSTIPAARLIKIWKDYAQYGVVRDERGMDEIVNRIIKNIARLAINTEIVGHSAIDPEQDYEEDLKYYNIKKKDMERLRYFIQNDKFSDYALAPLQKIAFDLLKARTYEEKLLLVDKALNIVHQRGDIAAVFVEGGRKTLSYLANS